MTFVQFIFVFGCAASAIVAAVPLTSRDDPSLRLTRSELIRSQKVSEQEGAFSLFGMVSGNVPPGGQAIVITRWDEDAAKVASVRNAYEALGIDVVVQASPTDTNVHPKELAEAAIFPGPHMSPKESMIALAHMMALKKGSESEGNWTLILEEDARPLPIGKDRWLAGFNACWNRLLKRDVAMVRLGWCGGGHNAEVEDLDDGFQLLHHIAGKDGSDEGICTTGYIVNKKYISRILETFPVKVAIDIVWHDTLLKDPEFTDKVYSITRKGADAMYRKWTFPDIDQHGLIAQSRRQA
jgi:hypothetical protein